MVPRLQSERPVRRAQAGFTLIEVMIVVIVLGVLASVAVVAYGRYARDAKKRSEIAQIFGELRAKEEQYHAEFGRYLPTVADGWMPTATPSADVHGDTATAVPDPLPDGWRQLKANPAKGSLHCSYVVGTNGAEDDGAYGKQLYGGTFPPGNYFYLLAICDIDNDGKIGVYGQPGDQAVTPIDLAED